MCDTTSNQIQLTDGFGKMNKCKQEAIIRFRRYYKDAEPTNWYRASYIIHGMKTMQTYQTYREHYSHVKSLVLANEDKYTKADVEDVDIDENSPPEHVWNQIAPSTEEARAQSLAEGRKFLTEISQQDLQVNASLLQHNVLVCMSKQRAVVMFHRNWCKKAVLAMKQGKPVEPYHVFLSGPGGVGKSPTGVPAFNISGMTLYSALLLGHST